MLPSKIQNREKFWTSLKLKKKKNVGRIFPNFETLQQTQKMSPVQKKIISVKKKFQFLTIGENSK